MITSSQHYVTTYSVRGGFLMLHQTLLALLQVPTVADQLLILFLNWWARPPHHPPPRADPISLRVHVLTHSSVRYMYVFLLLQRDILT
jgi:hypothetical protein